jgi:hypothetical protein
MVFAVLMLLTFGALGVYMVYSGIKSRTNARASEIWPVAGGTVLASEIESKRVFNPKSRTVTHSYEPIIRYSYKVAGTDYESSTVRFGDLVRNSDGLAKELVARYPVGSTVAVHYDPADPRCAALESVSAGWRQMVMGAAFIAVPLFILVITLLTAGWTSVRPSLPPDSADLLNRPN